MKIHFIAIGGAIMHNLAIALKNKGYQVSGSDDEIFDPAKTNLEKHGLLPESFGWHPERITPDLDVIILGMHAKPGNPELDKAMELGLKIYSFPEYIYEQSKDKTRVVIAGSHGKTTITSMIMHVLNYRNKDFDYLVGSQVEGFDIMVRLSDAPVIVIEGDEYLTSALDPRPKFLHYKPQIALITGIAWDHINVFKTEEIYIDQFRKFLDFIEKDGEVIYCNTDRLLTKLVKEHSGHIHKTSYNIPEFEIKDGIAFLHHKGKEIPLGIFGNHNLVNLNGAMTVCRKLGIEEEQFIEAIRTFTGAGKRLELLGENENTSVFKDFAHAPSKVRASVDAVKQRNPERDLVAILELHTYSSLSKHFLPHYREHKSLESADMPVVYFSQHAIKLKKLPPIEKEDIEAAFQIPGLRVFTDSDQLRDFILNQGWHNKNLLMMSSGNFGGIDLNEITEGICNK